MRSKFLSILVVAAIALAGANPCRAQQITITPDKTNGVYQVGDTVQWRVEWMGEATNAPVVRYKFLKGGLTDAGQGELNFSNGVAGLETKFDAPGTMLVEAKWNPETGRANRAVAGAVADPGHISLAAPCPADFDAFWRAKLKELSKVPLHPELEPVDIGRTNLLYWKITMGNIRGTHIRGQLARPAQGKKFPALLIVQWAGVYGLEKNWVTDRAAEGWLALDIEPHDLPIDQPASFYKEQFDGPLKNYWAIGNDDRDTSYFLRMYLSGYRAIEYLTSRPDWDGRTLVVMGDSQGGQQTLMVAGLHPRQITAALALVPAGCDMFSPELGRAPGFPQWYYNTWGGKDPNKVRQASLYYDTAFFSARIQCPVLVGTGLRDEVCPPAGVLAMVNQITSPKELIILPRSGHQNQNCSQQAYDHQRYSVWLPALRQGKPAPVKPLK